MKRIEVKYPCLLLLLSVLALCVSSCSSDGPGTDTDRDRATLTVTARLIDSTREGMTDDEKEIEWIRSLRIIILRSDGTVEHNRLVTRDDPAEQITERFLVTPRENKHVLLLANEKSVTEATLAATGEMQEEQITDLTEWLDNFTIGSKDLPSQAGRIMFRPKAGMSGSDKIEPIPMTSLYRDQYVSDAEYQELSFYVVRTAVKFTFEFTSERSDEVTIDQINISSIADHTWLMPHLNENASVFKGRNWIEWLRDASDESQSYPDSTELADNRGWIKDYDIPDVSEHSMHSVPVTFKVPGRQDDGTRGELTDPRAYYCMESRYNGNDLSDSQTAAPDEDQIYRVSFRIGGRLLQRALPNLRALFRNTHVRIKVSLGQLETDDAIFARIVDWDYIGYDVNGRLEPEVETEK